MPLQKRMEMIRPNIFQPVRDPRCKEKLQRTDLSVRQWRPAMPVFPRNNLRSTLYNLKKPFYPMFMYEKPDMKKIMTEEYRRMWQYESMKFLCGLDIRESARLPRRPFIKYGLLRDDTGRPSLYGCRRKPPTKNPKFPYLSRTETGKRKKHSYHEDCLLTDRYKPFKARPVPSCIKTKASSQQTCANDCTVTFDTDCHGNQVCNVHYADNNTVTDYYQNQNFNRNADQTSEGYGPEVYKTIVFNSDGTQNCIDDGQSFANDEMYKSVNQYEKDNTGIPLDSSQGNLNFKNTGYYSIIDENCANNANGNFNGTNNAKEPVVTCINTPNGNGNNGKQNGKNNADNNGNYSIIS